MRDLSRLVSEWCGMMSENQPSVVPCSVRVAGGGGRGGARLGGDGGMRGEGEVGWAGGMQRGWLWVGLTVVSVSATGPGWAGLVVLGHGGLGQVELG